MEVQDGFIVGVFNYCDRWCERCPFTSHCRVFADHVEMEAALDPGLKAVVDAAIDARAQDYAVRTNQWLTACDRGLAERGDSPQDVISWFHFFIAAKIRRALTVWADEGAEDRSLASDTNGSAKIALIAIERSHAAWLELVDRAIVPAGQGEPV